MPDATVEQRAPARWAGISAVLVTPFTSDGSKVDLDRLEWLVDTLIDDGLTLLVSGGNTGEYFSLSELERRQVAEAVIARARGRASVIVGSAGSVDQVRAEMRVAAETGAAAVMVHHPPHPFMSSAGILAYLEEIARDAPLPVIPYLRDSVLSTEHLARLVRLDAIEAVKFAHNDLVQFADVVTVAADQSVEWICGTAELWAPFFWAAGASGFTSGLVNVSARQSLRMLALLEADDRVSALAVWQSLRRFEVLRARHNAGFNVSVVKAAMRLVGRDVGPVRPPSSEIPDYFLPELESAVEAWGLPLVPLPGLRVQ